MARGRVVDQALFLHEELSDLPIQARYLYVGLIVKADDAGRIKASAKHLRATIFPHDESMKSDTVAKWRDALIDKKIVQLYVVDGQEYITHPNWEKWQPLRKDRTKPSDCPAPLATKCQPTGNQVATNGQPNDNQRLPVRGVTVPNQTISKLTKGEGNSHANTDARDTDKYKHSAPPPSSAAPSSSSPAGAVPPASAGAAPFPPAVAQLVDAYLTEAKLPVSNEKARQVLLRQHGPHAQDLLTMAGGDLAKAKMCVKHCIEDYRDREKPFRNFTMKNIVEDFPVWEQGRIAHERKIQKH